MVGIPGKSLGCHNCRRRKIKCDLAKPHCERCTKTGRTCEGYVRETIFHNRTIAGSGKETKPEGNPSRSSTPTAHSATIPPQIGQTLVLRHRIEGVFLEQYLAKDSNEKWPSPGMYLVATLRELPHDLVLEPAIQALCMTRVGRFQRDLHMLRQGHQAYVLALRRLSVAISKPDVMVSVGTLAAAKILNLYEQYEPSDGSVKGLYDHISGVTNLIALRGHARHKTHTTKLILETSRFNSMVNSIVGWKHSPLSRVQWRTTSWDTATDFEQRLYDVGYALAGIMDDLHLFTQGPTLNVNDTARTSLASRWLAARENLTVWYRRLTSFAPVPMFRQAAEDRFEYMIYHGRSFEFPYLMLAHMLMDYWAIKIFCSIVLEALYGSVSQESREESPDLLEISALRIAMENVSVLEQFDWARHIEASVNYCCQAEMGWVGPQRTMFPLRVALVLYRRTPGAVSRVKKRDLRDMIRKLPERTGLFVANFLPQRWSAPWELSKHFEELPEDQNGRPASASSVEQMIVADV